MRIVDLGTFLLPARFSLSMLMSGERDRLMSAVDAALPECQSTSENAPISEVLLDFHRSQGARQMESMIFEGRVEVEGLGPVGLYISSLSVGFVVVEFELPDDTVVDLESSGSRQSFKSYETPVSEALRPLIADWAERATRAVPGDLIEPRTPGSLPAGQLLWWHRIAVNPLSEHEFPAARWYGTRADLADGMYAMIGSGFSMVYGDRGRVVTDVVEGLMVATQEWLIVDEAKRLLAEHLVRLSRTREAGLVSVDAQYLEVLQLTEEVTLRNLVLSEEMRYLANARIRVREATALAWRMEAESAELEQRTTALRDLFGLHRERITNDRDDRRNRIITVLTVITLIQGVLVWYDFLTEDDTTVSSSPRPGIAILVVLTTVLMLLGMFNYRFSDAARRWWRRLNPNRRGGQRPPRHAPRSPQLPVDRQVAAGSSDSDASSVNVPERTAN